KSMNLENSQRVEVTDDRHKIILEGAVPSAGTNLSLVKSTRKLPFYQAKWGLKQCLLALGFSLEEMRYRKGCRSIIENWVNEEKELLELVKKRWKELAVQYHEARGGDPEKWKNVNAIYSCALKK